MEIIQISKIPLLIINVRQISNLCVKKVHLIKYTFLK